MSYSYLCFQLTLLHSVPYSFLLYHHLLRLYEVLSINPSANAVVFGDFNIYHKGWLTHPCETDRPGELCYNFSISNDLTQMVKFPTRIPDSDSHSPALLYLFLSSDIGICYTMASSPLGNSDHVVVSVSIDFPSNSKWDALLHHIAYDYSGADSAFAAGTEFCEWVQIGIYVYIPHLSIRLSLTDLHGFQLLVLLPQKSLFLFAPTE